MINFSEIENSKHYAKKFLKFKDFKCFDKDRDLEDEDTEKLYINFSN